MDKHVHICITTITEIIDIHERVYYIHCHIATFTEITYDVNLLDGDLV